MESDRSKRHGLTCECARCQGVPEHIIEQRTHRYRVKAALDAHLLTPTCRSCADDFDVALASYREKYAR